MLVVIARRAAVPSPVARRLAIGTLALFFIFSLQARADQTITLRSGNGTVGSQDSQVRFVHYAVSQDAAPTSADFLAAQTGTFAYIDAPYPTYISPSKFSDPTAKWVGTTSGLGDGSALYAIPFMVTDTTIQSASLDLGFAVDNALHGVYINGTSISNFANFGDFTKEYQLHRSDIASLLIPNAVNWLYLKDYDYGGYAGLLFSATINTQSGPVVPPACIDYSSGFTSTGITLNGGATITGDALQLTDGKSYEGRSAFYTTTVPVSNFVTDFTFQLLDPQADGIAFVVQSNAPTALGDGEGGLGYHGIPDSTALKFDLWSNYGEGPSSTGFFQRGVFPAIPSVNLLPSGVDLHSGHIFAVHIVYDGSVVDATITDTVTKASYTVSDTIPALAGSDRAYVGFTGGSGRLSATQNILSWSYSSTLACTLQ